MSSRPAEPPPAPGLTAEWQDWLAGNVVRGCTDADMLATMREQGFDAAYARIAIAVVRSMTERVRRENPAALDPYAATDPAEFFAVASEAFFVDNARFRAAFPALDEVMRAFYRQQP